LDVPLHHKLNPFLKGSGVPNFYYKNNGWTLYKEMEYACYNCHKKCFSRTSVSNKHWCISTPTEMGRSITIIHTFIWRGISFQNLTYNSNVQILWAVYFLLWQFIPWYNPLYSLLGKLIPNAKMCILLSRATSRSIFPLFSHQAFPTHPSISDAKV
jgi:hypothetical protein